MNNLSKSITSWQASMKLPVLLAGVLICSSLFSIGVALVFGSVIIGGDYRWEGLILGIIFIFGSPILIGLFLRFDNRGGLSGVLGLIWVVMLWPVMLSGAFRAFIFPWMFILGPITIVLAISERLKQMKEFAGLFLGLLIGYILTLLAVRYIPNPENTGFGPMIVSFLFIWLSAVFFTELLSGRTGWRGVLVWLVMMAVPVVLVLLLPG